MDTGSNSPGRASRPVVSDNWSDFCGGNSSGLHFLDHWHCFGHHWFLYGSV